MHSIAKGIHRSGGKSDYSAKKHFKKLLTFNPGRLRPWFPRDAEITHSGHRHPRPFLGRVHVAMGDEESKFGTYFTIAIMAVITMSCVTFVLETMPDLLQYDPECVQCKPLRGDDYGVEELEAVRAAQNCTGCEPHTPPIFDTIETAAISIFTTEYTTRVLTAHLVRSAQEKATSDVFVFPKYRAARRTWLFVSNPMNLIDLVAILPFYLNLLSVGPGGQLAVIRVLRLLRVFRILKFGALSEGVSLFSGVMAKSMASFGVFFVFSAFGMVVLAALVFFAEKGTWNPETGEFERPGAYYLDANEPSPFTSIPRTFWWVLVTFTTVGYGDMFPTTSWGRFLGTVTMYTGIILVAMPITIMGVNLAELYGKQVEQKERYLAVRRRAAGFLHTMFTGPDAIKVRRSFNMWRQFAQDLVRQETELPYIVRAELKEVFGGVAKALRNARDVALAEGGGPEQEVPNELGNSNGLPLEMGVLSEQEKEDIRRVVAAQIAEVKKTIVDGMAMDLETLRQELL